MIPILALLLTLLALFLLWQAARQRKAAGLPGGRVIYADTRAWGPVEKPLFDPELGLTGKPDYLVQRGNAIIPVEVKSARVGTDPHDSHIYQLGAYCLLVQRSSGKRPPYGILHYPNRTFAIDYTGQMSGVPIGAGKLRIWLPVPQDSTVQSIRDLSFSQEPRITTEPKYGNKIAYWEFDKPPSSVELTMKFVCQRREAVVDLTRVAADGKDSPSLLSKCRNFGPQSKGVIRGWR